MKMENPGRMMSHKIRMDKEKLSQMWRGEEILDWKPFSQLPLVHSTAQPWLFLLCQVPNRPLIMCEQKAMDQQIGPFQNNIHCWKIYEVKQMFSCSMSMRTFWVRPKSATLARRFPSSRTFLAARSLCTRKWVSRYDIPLNGNNIILMLM